MKEQCMAIFHAVIPLTARKREFLNAHFDHSRIFFFEAVCLPLEILPKYPAHKTF